MHRKCFQRQTDSYIICRSVKENSARSLAESIETFNSTLPQGAIAYELQEDQENLNETQCERVKALAIVCCLNVCQVDASRDEYHQYR